MRNLDGMDIAVLTSMMGKAEPKLAAALAKLGVSSPDQLAPEIAAQVFQDAMVQTAIEHFPDAQVEALKHGLKAFVHPLFGPAFKRLKMQAAQRPDAFAMASGVDAAIVMAGFGLPVAPFDRKTPRILAEPTNDLDSVAATFSKWKSAYVGYSPCDIPFYMLLTDCVRTMLGQIETQPALHQAKALLKRSVVSTPSGARAFQHGLMVIAREPGETISTAFLNNPDPSMGSVGLYAGWTVGAVREGAPNDGFLPVPMQFLQAAIDDPQFAYWLWKPTGARVTIN
ncbi:MAG: hypothetical protein ABII76_11620 [Pseudomonadota bacterium]